MRSYNPGKMGLFERAKRKALPYLFALGSAIGCGNNDGPSNSAPVAVNDTAVVLEDSVNNLIDVLANDSDTEDGKPVLDAIVSAPLNGTAVILGDKINYIPDADFFGNDNFTYRVRDSKGLMDTAGVNITASNVNDAPVITSGAAEKAVINNAYTYDVNAYDADNAIQPGTDILTYSLTTSPAGMTINNSTGLINWTPGTYGSNPVSVQVSDGKGGTDTQDFNLLAHSPYNDLTGKLHYVIVTNNEMSPAFQALADWKTSKGVMTQVFSLEDIINTGTGRDNAEKLRNFLKTKRASNPELEYVLLGGDWEVVPMRGAYGQATGYPEDFNIPTDLYFSDLDGSWDADNDNVFGEVPGDGIDMHPDLFVGRAPVSNTTEAGTFVGKVLLYETGNNGSDNLDTGYITKGGNNVLFCAEKLSATTDSAVAKDWINPNVFNFASNGYGLGRLYETQYNGGQLEDAVSVMNALNTGWHVVNIYGHGGEDILQVGAGLTNYIHSRDGSPAEKDIRNLTNLTRPFILYSLGCMTNAFDNVYLPTGDCIGEHFILNPAGGAVASIGESRIGLYNESLTTGEGISWGYDSEFFKSLFNEGKTNLGKAFADSKNYYSNTSKIGGNVDYRWVQYCLNLLGDPEMNVWSNYLGSINAAVTSGSGYTDVAADVLGAPLSGANVYVRNGASVYSALTDANGRALIPATGTVVVTKKDYMPFVE